MNASRETLLLVEDDLGIQKQVKWSLDGYDVQVAGDRESAISQIRRFEPSVVILDLGLPPDPDGASEGLFTLEQILMLAPGTKAIVVTGNQDMANAVRAIGLGAYDFYQKPFESEMLSLIVGRALRLHKLEQENYRLRLKQMEAPMQGIISSDPHMLKICRTMERVAPSDATVLILGESGTGKELLARALHQLSSRSDKRLVAINCAAIPENLLESELFGFEKGAFTGASKQTIGRIEYANGGTLFLDEIGDLPFSLQAKLLRFLQERVIERLGGRGEIPVDVRVVCATNRSLVEEVKKGRFRDDLYFRISVVVLSLPPLRDRREDIELLCDSFLQRGEKKMTAAQDAVSVLQNYDWPGNVRELRNVIETARAMCSSDVLHARDLIFAHDQDMGAAAKASSMSLAGKTLESIERAAIAQTLAHFGGNRSAAARALGIAPSTLYLKLKKYGIG